MPDKKFSQFCDIGSLSPYLSTCVLLARFLAEPPPPFRGRCDVTLCLNIHAVKLKSTCRRCSTYVVGNVRHCSADRTVVIASLIIILTRHVSSPSVGSVTPTLLGLLTRNAATLSRGPAWVSISGRRPAVQSEVAVDLLQPHRDGLGSATADYSAV